MKISQNGLNLIKECEGLELNAYYDPVGILTIGVGHTGNDIYPGMQITEEKAMDLLREDVGEAENAVNQYVKVKLSQNQFDALVSFTFNVGSGNLKNSTLLRELNNGKYDAVPTQLARWNKASGKVLPGLTKRRAAEGNLFKK